MHALPFSLRTPLSFPLHFPLLGNAQYSFVDIIIAARCWPAYQRYALLRYRYLVYIFAEQKRAIYPPLGNQKTHKNIILTIPGPA